MRQFRIRLLVVLFAIAGLTTIATAVDADDSAPIAKITYVSIEGVYIDAGSEAGLALGDTLKVRRNGVLVATVVINNISSRASAAQIVLEQEKIVAGDIVFPLKELIVETRPEVELTPTAELEETDGGASGARYRGNVSLSNYLHSDMTNADLGWTRPGLATRLTIDNIGRGGLRFELRHRSRLYHRSRAVRVGEEKDEWTHQVYQLALFNDEENGLNEWGVGRLITPYVRGVGYVDGGYFARSVSGKVKVGIAAGTVPDREDGSFSSDTRKAGIFVAYETGNRSVQSLDMSLALSAENRSGMTSRDFAYLQAAYTRGNWLSMFHSAEIDYNRHWRYNAAGERLSFTNYFGRATVSPSNKIRFYLSYDLRRMIRYIETSNLPDSLFDDRDSRGLRGGGTFRLSDRTTVGLSGGVRFSDNDFKNPVTGSFYLRLNKFPRPGQSVSLYFSYINTEFTTGYRPMVYYRFPIARRLLISLSGAAHIYKTGTATTTNSYADLATSYNFLSGLYLSGNVRQYFDSELKAFELFTEIGWGW